MIRNNTNNTALYYLWPGGGVWDGAVPEWDIHIYDCGPIHSAFEGQVNASSGIVSAATDVGENCGLPLNRSLDFDSSSRLSIDPPFEIANTSSYSEDRANVTSVNGTISWAKLSAILQLNNPFGVATQVPRPLLMPVTSGWTLTALDPSNATLATYDPATWTWSTGGSVPIVAGDHLEIRLSSSVRDSGYGTDLQLWLGGTGAFWGIPMVDQFIV